MLNQRRPLFSIVIATFNAALYLERTLLSIVSQVFVDFEIILIDGGSSDDTLNILEKYKGIFTHLVSEKDNGIYEAWNKGVLLCKGDWILFLGADDILLPNALDEYQKFITLNIDGAFEYISSKVVLINSSEKELRTIGSSWKWAIFKKYMCVAHVGSLHHQSIFNKYGLFNLNFKITGDYDFLLRARSNLKAGFLNLVTVKMQIGGVSNKDLTVFDETFKSKITSGGRNYFAALFEKNIAILKYFIRTILSMP